MCAIATAGGLSFFLILYDRNDYCRYDRRKDGADYDSPYVTYDPCKHDSLLSFIKRYLFTCIDLPRQLRRSLAGAYEHIDHEPEQKERCNKAYRIHSDVPVKIIAREQSSERVYHKSYCVSKAALIAYGEPCPLCAVHFTSDSAYRRYAGSAEELEYQEREPADAGEGCTDIMIYRPGTAVKNSEGAYYVLFGDNAGERCDHRLPVAPTERSEHPRDSAADEGEYRVSDLIRGEHTEASVNHTEV